MATNKCDYTFKLALASFNCSGKTCLFSRFINNTYPQPSSLTIGVDFGVRKVNLDGKAIALHIWDTCGQERMFGIISNYFRNVHGIILVYDVANAESFDSLKYCLQSVSRYTPKDVNKLLVGNKCDLIELREVSCLKAKEYADSLGISFFEVSAKDSTNVEEALMTFVMQIYSRLTNKPLEAIAAPLIPKTETSDQCTDCKNASHVQCLHCSKLVCMECAQKHLATANEQVTELQHTLNDKMSIIDQLSAAAKTRVDSVFNDILKEAREKRDQAFSQIDQMADKQKQLIRDKNTQITRVSLYDRPAFISHTINDLEYVNEQNNQLFTVSYTFPEITVEKGQ